MIWYVGYGSNLDRDRFARYLAGGRPPGAARATPGARDSSPPLEERAVTLPGSVFFGHRSLTWGGGVAFLDAEADDAALGRAYLVSDAQFSDIAHQEMHRDPGEDLDLAAVLRDRRHSYGPGRYETLHLVGELEGHPMLTFSAAHHSHVEPHEPAEAYLAMMARGLRQTHGLGPDAVAEYLLARPGIGGWDHEGITSLAA